MYFTRMVELPGEINGFIDPGVENFPYTQFIFDKVPTIPRTLS